MPPTSSRPSDRTVRTMPWGIKETRALAEDAARNARTEMQKRGWSSGAANSVKARTGKGFVALETSVKYVMYQNKGTEPFLMTWVEGRVVPMNGGTSFRYGKDVGKPGWVTLPGGVRRWRDQKWRHPGITGTHFMEKALNDAINKHKPKLRKRLINVLMGEYHDG